MQRGPVVIIGASSAGLLTAYLLAREGVAVSVYEQAERLAPAPRTLIVTSDIIPALGFMPEAATINTVHTFELHTKRKSARITLRAPDLIMDRGKLIRLLAAKAEKAGAQLHFGYRFSGLETDGGRSRAILDRLEGGGTQRLEAGVIIGADGVHSEVVRTSGKKRRPQIALVQARVSLPPNSHPDVSQVWFVPQDTPFFYWLIPESPASAVVGIAAVDHSQARSNLDNFLRERGMEPLEYQSALIPAYRPGLTHRHGQGPGKVLTVGDAAGQVKMTTVGGTVTGAWGARAVVAAVLGAPNHQPELRRLTGELNLHWLIRNVLDRFGDGDYDALLGLLNGRVKRVLEARNRDVMAGAFRHLLAAQPRLLLLAAKALVSSAPRASHALRGAASVSNELGRDVQGGV